MNEFYKCIGNFDLELVRNFYHSIEKKIEWLSETGRSKQSSLQYAEQELEYLSGTGKSKFMFSDTRNKILSEIYKNTICQDLIEKYALVRTRWMWLEKHSCYSLHSDSMPRIHFPLYTHPACYFLFPEQPLVHLEVGKVYIVNTVKKHTFINCSEVPRLHLVGSILTNYDTFYTQ